MESLPRKSKPTKLCPLVGSGILFMDHPKDHSFVWSWTPRVYFRKCKHVKMHQRFCWVFSFVFVFRESICCRKPLVFCCIFCWSVDCYFNTHGYRGSKKTTARRTPAIPISWMLSHSMKGCNQAGGGLFESSFSRLTQCCNRYS